MLSLATFKQNLSDFERLLEIHTNEGGGGQGRKHRLEVLNKASIVLLTAFWEAFCEDTVSEAMEHIVQHAVASDQLPLVLRKKIAAEIKSAAHALEPWSLSGEGWRQYLLQRLARMKAERDFLWNTPKHGNVDNFFKDALGVDRISDHWKYASRVTPEYCRTTLNKFVELRGSIAHRGQNENPVLKSDTMRYHALLTGIAGRTSKYIDDLMVTVTGVPPAQ